MSTETPAPTPQPNAAKMTPERLYDLAIIRTDATRRKLTGYPMTHAECCVMKSKFSEEEQSRIIFVPSQSVSDPDHGTQGNTEAALHAEIGYLKEKLGIAASAQNNAREANIGLVKQLRESDDAHARLLAENAALVNIVKSLMLKAEQVVVYPHSAAAGSMLHERVRSLNYVVEQAKAALALHQSGNAKEGNK